MAPMASNEGRRGTEAGLWALLSTMPTRAIIISIRCSQTVCSGSIVRPRPARLVSANRGHPNPTKPWLARDTLTALARRATTTLAHQPGQASTRHEQGHSGKLPVAEGPRWFDLSCPALLHVADPTEHQAHAHPSGPRQWSLPEVTPAPTCGLGPIRPRRKNAQQNPSNPPSCGQTTFESALPSLSHSHSPRYQTCIDAPVIVELGQLARRRPDIRREPDHQFLASLQEERSIFRHAGLDLGYRQGFEFVAGSTPNVLLNLPSAAHPQLRPSSQRGSRFSSAGRISPSAVPSPPTRVPPSMGAGIRTPAILHYTLLRRNPS
ncbi:hypothetical protein BKA70DRAFT_1437915 [Coprinopsis sp. MPI-PUGE-AT-0042]|nr:hypothetical protein BKA70DRAFT_1437915 [Coprinopsis sp. MPI-PUGE-AT-0042]